METNSETHALLSRIAGLRHRLEQAHVRGKTPLPHRDEPVEEPAGLARLWELAERVAEGFENARQLDDIVQTQSEQEAPTECPLPKQLTARARRVLEHGRELLHRLRSLGDDPAVAFGKPLAGYYRGTTAMADAALRIAAVLPDSASKQLHVAEGMEVLLRDVAARIDRLETCLVNVHEENRQIDLVATYMQRLCADQVTDLEPVSALAQILLTEAAECRPLRFVDAPIAEHPDEQWLSRFIACHSLTVAQVMARVVRHDPDLRHRAQEAVMAALLHDIGMLQVPPPIVASVEPLDDEARRRIEWHARRGAETLAHSLPTATWLTEAALAHHERSNGTGYPGGLRAHQVTPLTRLLAVCDVYAAGCTARPHRAARDPRTALTDTLLLAEKGLLDSHHAERLLHLSFYPIGSVVELADGAIGVVVAIPGQRMEAQASARPIVSLLLGADGRPLPTPIHVDLLQCESRSILRTVPALERRRLLAASHPELL